MPFAHVIVPAGSLGISKRKKIVELVTAAIIEAEKMPPSLAPYVTVIVSEAADGGWGISGHGYTTPELAEHLKSVLAPVE